MGKKSSIKSNLNALTAFMVVFLTSIFAVIAYAFVHFEHLSAARFVVLAIVVALLIGFFAICAVAFVKNNKTLEGL